MKTASSPNIIFLNIVKKRSFNVNVFTIAYKFFRNTAEDIKQSWWQPVNEF